MKRRLLIRNLGVLTLTPLFLNSNAKSILRSKHLFNEWLIEPTTAITIGVGIAKWFIGFFQSNNGPSIADFAKNLSDQIGVTNQKLDLIINQGTELKKLFKELPLEIISKMNQIELKARLEDYKAIMTTVSNPRTYNGNIAKYWQVDRNKQAVNKLVSQIADLKGNLRQFNDPFLVPFIAAAIHIEYYLRNNFMKEKINDLVGPIGNDKNWLQANIFDNDNSLEKTLKVLRQNRGDLISNNAQFVTRARFYKEPANMDGGWGIASQGIEFLSCRLKVEVDSAIVEDDDILVLRRNGLLTQNELPSLFRRDTQDVTGGNGDQSEPEFSPDLKLPYAKQSELHKAYREEKLKNLNENFKLNYYSIIANTSCYFAGIKALELCNIYLRIYKMK